MATDLCHIAPQRLRRVSGPSVASPIVATRLAGSHSAETALSEEWRRDFERQSELEALAVPSEDGRGLNNEEAARFGRS